MPDKKEISGEKLPQVLPAIHSPDKNKRRYASNYVKSKETVESKDTPKPVQHPSRLAAFKKLNLTVEQYFKKLVVDSQPYDMDLSPEQRKQRIKTFYIDCLELIEDSAPDALSQLEKLTTAAEKNGLTKNDLKESMLKKQKDMQPLISAAIKIKEPVVSHTLTPEQKPDPLIKLKESVEKALNAQIVRLEKKLTGFFVFNKELAEEKVATLKGMKNIVKEAKNINDIYKVMHDITNDSAFKTQESRGNKLVVQQYNAASLDKHRIGFLGHTDTHNNLVTAFKSLKPSSK